MSLPLRLDGADLRAALDLDPEAANAVSFAYARQRMDDVSATRFGMLTTADPPSRPSPCSLAYRRAERLRHFIEGQLRLPCVALTLSAPFAVDGFETTAVEPWMLVPGIPLPQLLHTDAAYARRHVLYAGPETDGEILLFADGGFTPVGAFDAEAIASAISARLGSPHRFRPCEPTAPADAYAWGRADRDPTERALRADRLAAEWGVARAA